MPLEDVTLDERKYQDLLNEALARIPVHNPEWTNFNKSDPGVTLLEIFAFLTESLLYRANQIPERNRRKFLSLVGVPLQPASAARGIVMFTNERGPLQTFTFNDGLEVRAGQMPFRTEQGLDVLPVEARAYVKRKLETDDEKLKEYYRSLFVSFQGGRPPPQLVLYETAAVAGAGTGGIDIGLESVDGALWIALLVREGDKPFDSHLQLARDAIANKTINLGLVPVLDGGDAARRLPPGNAGAGEASSLSFDIPSIPESGGLPEDRKPAYRTLRRAPVPAEPTVVEFNLPAANALKLWNNLEPLEEGADQLPPALEDTATSERVVTWVRVTWPKGAQSKIAWAGINTVFVQQRAHVANEILPSGNGRPDQIVALARKPVLSGSVRITVTPPPGEAEVWEEIGDLTAAGPEVPVEDLRLPPGIRTNPKRPAQVFALDAEAGIVRFGDGFRGMRPPDGATIRAEYDYSEGREGNVAEGFIKTAPALPAGIKVTNPVRTWCGADAETASEGEKQISRWLQHRDRLVTVADFEAITLRTPGVDIGRVEVLPVFSPELPLDEPGNAAGAVTLMVIPKFDAISPDTPMPDQMFINAICDWLDLRRLMTTELFVRGPTYMPIWISVGINVVAGKSFAAVREAVERHIRRFLAPLHSEDEALRFPEMPKGWPLRRAVVDIELMAEISRVPGVASVSKLYLAKGGEPQTANVPLRGLELPRIDGISVSPDQPIPLDEFRGKTAPPSGPSAPRVVPVPVIPEEC
jgi:hypothetical protein